MKKKEKQVFAGEHEKKSGFSKWISNDEKFKNINGPAMFRRIFLKAIAKNRRAS